MIDVIPGSIYEHFKRGDRYRVLALAKDHETQEHMVVYQAMHGERATFVRPAAMFTEEVFTPVGRVPRFRKVHDDRLIDFDTYQRISRATATYPDFGKNIIFPTLGLASAAGEVAKKIKKVLRDKAGQPARDDRQAIAKEMGDTLWYLTQLATELRISFNEIAAKNLDKIAARKKFDRAVPLGNRAKSE